ADQRGGGGQRGVGRGGRAVQRDQCAAVRAGAGGGGAVHGRNGNRERTAAPHPGEVVPGDESGAALRPGAEAEVRPLLRCRAAPGADRLGIVIEIRDLTKSFGRTAALDRLSFTAEPGRVTGFLGPNGAGKSTTLRLLLGLDRPDSGSALVFGGRYAGLRYPLRRVGSLIDADAVDGARRAGDHLRWLARSNRIGAHRVTEVLDLVGLGGAARRRVSGFSLGMRCRLGIAAALLGDPEVLVLDEPANGLDADDIRWLRGLLRSLAAEGRTVLLSSHAMSEVELTADHLVVIGGGRLLADSPVQDLVEEHSGGVLVRSPRAAELASVLAAAGARVDGGAAAGLTVAGLSAERIGDIAAEHGLPVYEAAPIRASLEE